MASLYPAYLNLINFSELEKRASSAAQTLTCCKLCPRNCGVNRLEGQTGECRTGAQARVYSFMAHHGEEKPLRGSHGSGTIFFSGCNLHCLYCQNSDISQDNYGLLVSAVRLADMMLDLQSRGCHNINLVSPSHVIPQILEALVIAVKKGLRLPLVFNTGGYDKVKTLKLLDGIVDIYMPDLKYADPEFAFNFSGIKDYPTINQAAVKEMHRQVGDLVINEDGIAHKGLLIRHLVLPNQLAGTERIMEFISQKISKDTYINVMDQYRPEYRARDIIQLNRRITREEFKEAESWALASGLSRLD